MTTGSPPSITATQELVVPRSIPITLPIRQFLILFHLGATQRGGTLRWAGPGGGGGRLTRADSSGSELRRRSGNDHQRRPRQPIVKTVALDDFRKDVVRRQVIGFNLLEGFVQAGVKSLSHRNEGLHSIAGERVPEQLVSDCHPLAQTLEVAAALGMLQSALEIVENGQKVLEQLLDPELLQLVFFLEGPLAKVFQVRRRTQHALVGILHLIRQVASRLLGPRHLCLESLGLAVQGRWHQHRRACPGLRWLGWRGGRSGRGEVDFNHRLFCLQRLFLVLRERRGLRWTALVLNAHKRTMAFPSSLTNPSPWGGGSGDLRLLGARRSATRLARRFYALFVGPGGFSAPGEGRLSCLHRGPHQGCGLVGGVLCPGSEFVEPVPDLLLVFGISNLLENSLRFPFDFLTRSFDVVQNLAVPFLIHRLCPPSFFGALGRWYLD